MLIASASIAQNKLTDSVYIPEVCAEEAERGDGGRGRGAGGKGGRLN